MDPISAFEQQLARVAAEMAGPVRPVDAMALVRSAQAGPVGLWSVVLRGFRGATTPAERGFTMSSALKVVVAAAIVALFGGFLLTGILTTPREDEMAPAAVTESPSPMTTEDLLSSMVTEEVERGVYRVLDDGVRDLTSVDASDIVAGYDGGIRLLWEDGFLRLGVDRFQQWPEGVTPVGYILEVAPDGTMWVIPRLDVDYPTMRQGTGFRTTDGEAWTAQPCPDECLGVMVAPDGSVWASWGPTVGRLGPSGWEPVTGLTDPPWKWGLRLFPTEAGDLYAWDIDWFDPLYRYEDGRWELVADSHFFVDVGWDGTVWRDGGEATFLTDEGVVPLPLRGAELTRLRDGEWEGWSAAHLPQIRYGFGHDHQFEAAPDGSVWFSLWRSADGSDPRLGGPRRWAERTAAVRGGRMVCDGLARFDGEGLDQFLPGQCIKMDIAADGSAWVLSDVEEGKALYVITPEAVMASE